MAVASGNLVPLRAADRSPRDPSRHSEAIAPIVGWRLGLRHRDCHASDTQFLGGRETIESRFLVSLALGSPDTLDSQAVGRRRFAAVPEVWRQSLRPPHL